MDALILAKLLILTMLLAGCGHQTTLFKKYQVTTGDTLHAIALRHKLDHRELARLNQLTPPYDLKVGQTLYISTPTTQKDANKPARIWQYGGLIEPVQPLAMNWVWPTKSHIIKKRSEGQSPANGIDIGGAIYSIAAAAGKVIYAGASIRGHGNLVILEHDDDYISAYSSMQAITVKEEEQVRQGQLLMQADRRDKKQNPPTLHFEIHYFNKPLDPRQYLLPKAKPTKKPQFNRF